MLSFQDCFEWRKMSAMSSTNDEIAALTFDSGEEDIFFITFSGFFDSPRNWSQIPKEYQQACAFELGSIMDGTNVELALFGFTKRNDDICRFGKLLLSKAWGKKRHKEGKTCSINVDAFSDDYKNYLTLCERFVNEGELPLDTTLANFFEVPASELIAGRYLPSFYTEDKRKARAAIMNEKTIPLGEIAEVLNPKKLKTTAKNVLVVQPKNIRFPVSFDDLKRGDATNNPLQKGDILINTIGPDFRAVVFEPNGDEPVYAGTSMAVVRLRENAISQEYLCFYLASDLAKTLMESLGTGVIMKRLRLKDLIEFPIVVPNMSRKYYRIEYERLSGKRSRDYVKLPDAGSENPKPAEMILDAEISKKINAYNEEELRSFLSSDINELNICYSNKAYKSAIILAGSILEAVLIDWLSEINGANYFEEDYMVRDRNKGYLKRADLIDYIDAIKVIERPRWLKEADMAHRIRKKRNLVHAKLCIESGAVNKESAKMVIGYLDKVLKTRGACISDKK